MSSAESGATRIERTPLEKLIFDIRVTAGSRFNAAARLGRRDKRSNVMVSVYSALLICVSIATFALPLGSSFIRYASFGGIVASILLLVMSMRNFAHQYAVEAEQMHRCALELNELKRRIQALEVAEATTRLPSFADEYSRVLERWSVNHAHEDFLEYKYKHKWDFEDIAAVPDKQLPDRKFQEFYSVSAAGVALTTLIGIAFTLFIAWVLWDSVDMLSDDTPELSANASFAADDEYANTLNALERAEQALSNAANSAAAENAASNANAGGTAVDRKPDRN